MYKSKLIAKDYCQQEGLDFKDTFFLVAKMVMVRSVVTLVATSQLYIF